MKTISNILDAKFQSFIDETDEWIFFTSLAEYIELAIHNPIINPITNQLIKERDEFYEILNKEEEKAKKSLLSLRKEFHKIVKSNKIKDAKLDEIDNEISMLLNGELKTSQNSAEFVFRKLSNYCWRLSEINKIEHFKDYCLVEEGKLIENCFEELISDYRVIRQEFDHKCENTVWGAFNQLLMIREIVFDSDATLRKLREESKLGVSFAYWCYKKEFQEIKDARNNPLKQVSKQGRFIFNQKDFKVYANRVHYFIISEPLKGSEIKNSVIKFGFNLKDEFTFWLKSDENRKWHMKNGDGTFSNIGDALYKMLQKPNEYILPDNEYGQTIKNLKVSLIKKLNLRADDIKDLFLREANHWGVNESYL